RERRAGGAGSRQGLAGVGAVAHGAVVARDPRAHAHAAPPGVARGAGAGLGAGARAVRVGAARRPAPDVPVGGAVDRRAERRAGPAGCGRGVAGRGPVADVAVGARGRGPDGAAAGAHVAGGAGVVVVAGIGVGLVDAAGGGARIGGARVVVVAVERRPRETCA